MSEDETIPVATVSEEEKAQQQPLERSLAESQRLRLESRQLQAESEQLVAELRQIKARLLLWKFQY